MAQATKQAFEVKTERLITRLLTTPPSELSAEDAHYLKLALIFETSSGKTEIPTRSLHGLVQAYDWAQLKQMIRMVGSYNDFEAEKVIKALIPHKNFINYDNTWLGRDYSPVLWLSLDKYSHYFKPKAKSLGRDLVKVAKCNELHWCYYNQIISGNYNFESDEPLMHLVPLFDDNGTKCGGEMQEAAYFTSFRVWWD